MSDRRYTGLELGITELRQGITELRQGLAETRREFSLLRHDMLGHFAEICRRFDRLEHGGQSITQALRRIEAGFADGRGRHEIIDPAPAS